MNVDRFLAHHGILENPFGAEEARHDPVFERLVSGANQHHPDFAKILGKIDRPSTSVVFGEKGSGKTAIRLVIGQKVDEYNKANPERRILLVPYDDLNPMLDSLVSREADDSKRSSRSRRSRSDASLDFIRLEDHQDAILSQAVTRLVSGILGKTERDEQPIEMPDGVGRRIKDLPRRQRVDLAVLAALYDQPVSGAVVDRWRRLRTKLRLGWRLPISFKRLMALLLTLIFFGLLITPILLGVLTPRRTSNTTVLPPPSALPNPGHEPSTGGWPADRTSAEGAISPSASVPSTRETEATSQQAWTVALAGISGTGAVVLWVIWLADHVRVWLGCRRVHKEMPAIQRTPAQLRTMLMGLRNSDLSDQPWPHPGRADTNVRYLLTSKLREVLRGFGYVGIMVLIDRIDEPTAVSGDPERMRAVVWPLLDNKFLQQEGVGVKLLLPIDLRHMLYREAPEFFQEARLDKQNLIDPLSWSGATLYDLCSARLSACRPPNSDPVFLTDLFEPEVSRDILVTALDQMHQPRDAFKFLYGVIQEHCRIVPEDKAKFAISKITLENVRRQQSQRVQTFNRGLTPA